MKYEKSSFNGGGLLAVSLLLNNLTVNATSSTIQSYGVLDVKDSNTNKQVHIDSKDLQNLQMQLDNLSTPTLKVTYHEHTDDCYSTVADIVHISNATTGTVRGYIYVHTYNDGTSLSTFKDATEYYVDCKVCKTRLSTKIQGQYITKITPTSGGVLAEVHPWSCALCKHLAPELSPYLKWGEAHYLSDIILICGKDESTIESVELVSQ